MTYNQLKKTITTLLQSNAMIKEVKFATPQDWLFATNQPEFPIACFMINSGSLNIGREQVYNVSFWFLDKAGMENEFEADVTSDQIQIAADIVSSLRTGSNSKTYLVDTNISYNVISDKFEDYLAGVNLSININTISDYDACNMPIVS